MAFVGKRYDTHQRRNHAREKLGKIVKDQGLPRSLDLLLLVLEHPARRRRGYFSFEQVAGPSASSRGIGCFFTDLKCRRWLFEGKRLVNPRVIHVGAGLRIGVGQEGC